MRTGFIHWTMFFVLGMLLWLASIGVPSHLTYRLVLMLAMFSWLAYAVWVPRSN